MVEDEEEDEPQGARRGDLGEEGELAEARCGRRSAERIPA